jgi:hypothetical protein
MSGDGWFVGVGVGTADVDDDAEGDVRLVEVVDDDGDPAVHPASVAARKISASGRTIRPR